MMARVILIRHAEVAARWKSICYGAMDVELSEAGHESCRSVAEQWSKRPHPYRIYHSGLQRTETLARMIGRHFPSVPIISDERLRERNYGQWQGKTWDEVYEADPNFHNLIHHPDDYRPPAGETTTEMQTRVVNWFHAVSRAGDNETIVAISHSGPIAALAGFCLAIPATNWDPWMVKYLDALYFIPHAINGDTTVTRAAAVAQ